MISTYIVLAIFGLAVSAFFTNNRGFFMTFSMLAIYGAYAMVHTGVILFVSLSIPAILFSYQCWESDNVLNFFFKTGALVISIFGAYVFIANEMLTPIVNFVKELN